MGKRFQSRGRNSMTKFTVEGLTGSCLPLFINNRFTESKGHRFPSFDPATGKEWATVSDATADEVDTAVRAAMDAMRNPEWRDMSQSNRGVLLGRLADLVARDADRLSRLEVQDNGKLLREMQALTNAVSLGMRYFAGMADKIEGTTIPVNKPDMLNLTLREPLGVVGIIVPVSYTHLTLPTIYSV